MAVEASDLFSCGQYRSSDSPRPPGRPSRGDGGWLIYWPLGYAIFHFGLYQVTLDSLDLDNPDLLIGSWAPPIWYHTARFGTT